MEGDPAATGEVEFLEFVGEGFIGGDATRDEDVGGVATAAEVGTLGYHFWLLLEGVVVQQVDFGEGLGLVTPTQKVHLVIGRDNRPMIFRHLNIHLHPLKPPLKVIHIRPVTMLRVLLKPYNRPIVSEVIRLDDSNVKVSGEGLLDYSVRRGRGKGGGRRRGEDDGLDGNGGETGGTYGLTGGWGWWPAGDEGLGEEQTGLVAAGTGAL